MEILDNCIKSAALNRRDHLLFDNHILVRVPRLDEQESRIRTGARYFFVDAHRICDGSEIVFWGSVGQVPPTPFPAVPLRPGFPLA